ncbi:tetratricopeptide repeat protein, partial [Arthrospira platensis SPKY2]
MLSLTLSPMFWYNSRWFRHCICFIWGVSELVSHLVRGNQLLRIGKLEEAVDAFRKAIALHPHFPGFQ